MEGVQSTKSDNREEAAEGTRDIRFFSSRGWRPSTKLQQLSTLAPHVVFRSASRFVEPVVRCPVVEQAAAGGVRNVGHLDHGDAQLATWQGLSRPALHLRQGPYEA